MKNTIITSVSALVFLVIGLFIGKSNKQIEIQTVIRTNIVERPIDRIVEKIVEKPVVEYIDKYITNVVEKTVQAEIPEKYLNYENFTLKYLNPFYISYKKLPPGLKSVSVNVLLDEIIKNKISSTTLKNSIEFELRKIGIKIDDKSIYSLSFTVDALENSVSGQISFSYSLSLSTFVSFFNEDLAFCKTSSNIYRTSSFGILGKSRLEQKTFNEFLTEELTAFCNSVLESRENTKN